MMIGACSSATSVISRATLFVQPRKFIMLQRSADPVIAPRLRESGGPFAERDHCEPRSTLAERLGIDVARLTPEFRRARQTIFRRNEVCEDVCIVSDGWAYRYLQLADGRRQILGVLLPGDVITAAAPFQPRLDYSVQALTDMHYRRLTGALSRALFPTYEANARLLHELTQILVAERRSADEQMIDLGQRQADERIAGLILRLRDRLDWRGEVKNESFHFPLRQQHVADMAGLTAVHVSRVFTKLRREGLVEISNGSIYLLNLPELRRLGDLR
jgi:CRP/FNR family transcriptional regulator